MRAASAMVRLFRFGGYAKKLNSFIEDKIMHAQSARLISPPISTPR